MTFEEIQQIVSLITYKHGWSFIVKQETAERFYLQIEVSEESDASICPFTGVKAAWKSGKKYMSPFMCRQEIVGTVLGAIKDAEMHELHEWFKYKGRAIYCPHFDPDVLAEMATLKNMNMRKNAMSMEE